MPAAPDPRRPCSVGRPLAGLLLPLLLAAPGCLTCAMWDRPHHSKGQTAALVALTPVTLAVDAALIAGYVYVGARGGNCSVNFGSDRDDRGCHGR